MALVSCPECAAQVSNQAAACVKCGYPVAARLKEMAVEQELNDRQQLEDARARKRATLPSSCLQGMCPVCEHWQYVYPTHCDRAVRDIVEQPSGVFRAVCAVCETATSVPVLQHCGQRVVSVSRLVNDDSAF